MSDDEVRPGLAQQIAALAPERDGRPVLVVDGSGDVAFAGPLALRQMGGQALDRRTRRVLARLASNGSTSLLRLRLGEAGWLAPVSFMARPLAIDGAPPLLALEGTAPLPRQADQLPTPDRDVAAEEGAPPIVEAAPFDSARLSADAPPDPRRIMAPAPTAATISEEAADTPGPDQPAEAAGTQPDAAETSPPALETIRFIFEIDADERLTYLSPDLECAVGDSARSAIGRTWTDLAQAFGLDPAGEVSDALKGAGGWSGITIGWPTETGERLGFALSALPMFDRGRTLVGFRGLGRSVPLEDAEPALPTAELNGPAAETAPPAAGPGAQPAPDAPQNEATVLEPEPAPEVDAARPEPVAIVQAPVVSESFTGNVVPLRDMVPRLSGLSSSEESAFDEIARRLSAAPVEIAAPEAGPSGADTTPITAPFDERAAPQGEDFARLLDRMPIGAVVLRAGAIDYANRAALDMLGHRDLASLAARGAEKLFAEPIDRSDAAPATVRLVSDDGVEVEAEARLSAIGWRGAPATLVSLRRAEGAVATAHAALEREREMAAILDAAADGVIMLDGVGRILSVNRGAESLFGFEGRDVVGSLFTLSLAPESRKAAFDSLDRQKAAAPGTCGRETVEALGLSRHGGAIPLQMTLGRVGQTVPEAGGPDRFCAVLRDVTAWKRSEEELIAAKRQSDRANAQKSEFLGKIGQEIRTPLTAIIGFAEVMMEERFGPIGSPRYKDYLRDIHVSGGHLINLVSDLLDITRVESGAMKLDFGPVDLNEIVSQAAALLQPQASREHVIIRTSLARAMPPVLADRRSIRQVMTNLASNAVRFSRPGGQVIVATAMTDVGQAVIRIRDAGAGMTKQEIARAFEPFRPLADNDAGGAGLGLPLTKALAEANEAALAFQSELGHGTLAEVTFPASRVLAV